MVASVRARTYAEDVLQYLSRLITLLSTRPGGHLEPMANRSLAAAGSQGPTLPKTAGAIVFEELAEEAAAGSASPRETAFVKHKSSSIPLKRLAGRSCGLAPSHRWHVIPSSCRQHPGPTKCPHVPQATRRAGCRRHPHLHWHRGRGYSFCIGDDILLSPDLSYMTWPVLQLREGTSTGWEAHGVRHC